MSGILLPQKLNCHRRRLSQKTFLPFQYLFEIRDVQGTPVAVPLYLIPCIRGFWPHFSIKVLNKKRSRGRSSFPPRYRTFSVPSHPKIIH